MLKTMPSRTDPAATRRALLAIASWIADETGTVPRPPRAQVADAVRRSARTLAEQAPGHSVEVRIPPYVAVQCIEGPRHTRGTPPNVVECPPRTWLRIVCGIEDIATAQGVDASGSRAAEVAHWLPLIRLSENPRVE